MWSKKKEMWSRTLSFFEHEQFRDNSKIFLQFTYFNWEIRYILGIRANILKVKN